MNLLDAYNIHMSHRDNASHNGKLWRTMYKQAVLDIGDGVNMVEEPSFVERHGINIHVRSIHQNRKNKVINFIRRGAVIASDYGTSFYLNRRVLVNISN